MHYKRDASEIMYINGKLLRKPIISQTPESEEIEIRYNKANFFQKFKFLLTQLHKIFLSRLTILVSSCSLARKPRVQVAYGKFFDIYK